MTTRYLTTSYWNDIRTVEVERETEKCVWVKGRRQHRRSRYDNYFDTYDQARQFLIDEAQTRLAQAEQKVAQRRALLETVQALEEGA